jgi:type IVB pilus formation R64 PilN family outer membrane protein
MKMKQNVIYMLAMAIAVLASSGCANLDSISAVRAQSAKAETESLAKQLHSDTRHQDAVSVEEGLYLAGHDVPIKEQRILPDRFNETATFRGCFNDLYDVARRMSSWGNVPVNIAQNVWDTPKNEGAGENSGKDVGSQPMAIDYTGTVTGLFNTICSGYGLSWEYNEDEDSVTIFRTRTETFTLAGSVGTVDINNVIANSNVMSQAGSESNDDSKFDGSQSTKLKVNLDFWTDIKDDLENMLSDYGTVACNGAAGTLTVTDTPQILRFVRDYVAGLNKRLGQQVAIAVRVYTLTVEDTADQNFSLKALFSRAGKVSLASGTADLISPVLSGGKLTAGIVKNASGSLTPWSGTSAVLEALRKQGTINLVTSGSGIALHNQPLPIQVVRSTGYLASVSQTTTADVGTTSTLDASSVTTGFSMMAIPTILDNREVILNYSINLSALEKLNEISSGDQTIQTPDVLTRTFMQRVKMKLGSTLVLAGFGRQQSGYGDGQGILNWQKQRQNTRDLIVISIEVNDVSEV